MDALSDPISSSIPAWAAPGHISRAVITFSASITQCGGSNSVKDSPRAGALGFATGGPSSFYLVIDMVGGERHALHTDPRLQRVLMRTSVRRVIDPDPSCLLFDNGAVRHAPAASDGGSPHDRHALSCLIIRSSGTQVHRHNRLMFTWPQGRVSPAHLFQAAESRRPFFQFPCDVVTM